MTFYNEQMLAVGCELWVNPHARAQTELILNQFLKRAP